MESVNFNKQIYPHTSIMFFIGLSEDEVKKYAKDYKKALKYPSIEYSSDDYATMFLMFSTIFLVTLFYQTVPLLHGSRISL